MDCWVDGDEDMDGVGRERSKRFDGWWDEGMPHIKQVSLSRVRSKGGKKRSEMEADVTWAWLDMQFGVVATGLGHGRRTLTCEVMEETANPKGGTEFRIISGQSGSDSRSLRLDQAHADCASLRSAIQSLLYRTRRGPDPCSSQHAPRSLFSFERRLRI